MRQSEREEILRILNQARDVTMSGIGTLQGCKGQLERLIALIEHGGGRRVEDGITVKPVEAQLDDAMMRELRETKVKLDTIT